ncbi:MAG: secondary thiamine-phosphate synthase enzyme YjbQ [Oscillospiraceae bacterium]|jgi:secondary thiamine-phosphate synthase enzyme
MKFYERKVDLKKNGVVRLTDWVEECVRDSGVKNGVAFLNAPHTTSGIAVAPDMLKDEELQDLQEGFARIIPARVTYGHQFDNTTDMAGHSKAAIMNTHLALIIEDGEVVKGDDQGIYFLEFDGPRLQKCWLAVYEDAE